MTTNPLTTVGLMLTLGGLVGSFFYIQLSQWLRDLLALRQKVELNARMGDEAQKKAIIECRIESRRLDNWYIWCVNLCVVGFVVFVTTLALVMVGFAAGDPLQPYIRLALVVFLLLFAGLSGLLMFVGWRNAQATRQLLATAGTN